MGQSEIVDYLASVYPDWKSASEISAALKWSSARVSNNLRRMREEPRRVSLRFRSRRVGNGTVRDVKEYRLFESPHWTSTDVRSF